MPLFSNQHAARVLQLADKAVHKHDPVPLTEDLALIDGVLHKRVPVYKGWHRTGYRWEPAK